MNHLKRKTGKAPLKAFFLSLTLLIGLNAVAQDKPPFWEDVQTIKAYDRIYAPPKDPILFIGSSSIRLWVDFAKTFKEYTVLNRGIGGAVTNDTDRYLDDLVFPYHPKQIVIYVGENDLAKSPDVETAVSDFKKLYTHLRAGLPEVPVIYLAIKGSPSREKSFASVIRANSLIQEYLKTQKNVVYLDVFKPLLDAQGKMQPQLFKEDMLHMNASGYKIWNKLLIPHLLK